MAKQTTSAAIAAPTSGTTLVVNSVAELKAAKEAGSAVMWLGDETDEARVARVIAANPVDKDAFQRDPASGKLLKVELEDERKFALLRTCRASGQVFVVRTSDVHQTFFARGLKPRGKSGAGRSMQAAPADALASL